MTYAHLNACLAVALLSAAAPAYARTLQCNKAQTYCVTEDTYLTVGDKIGIFNQDGELVATAVVHGMQGEKRALQIGERYGTISADDHIKLLDDPAEGVHLDMQAYQPHKEEPTAQIGASFGYSAFNFGTSAKGEEFDAYYQWRQWGEVFLIGRAAVMAASGNVRQYTNNDYIDQTESNTAFGLLGGLGYESNITRPFSLRLEAGIGVMEVHSTLGGSTSLNDQDLSDTKLKNGADFYGRWSLGGVYNVDHWHIELGFAESFIGQGIANTITLGLARDLESTPDPAPAANH